jgi:nicotinamidase-related amidase
MPKRNRTKTAIVVIDVINDLEFPGGDKVLPWARKMAKSLTPVLRRARRAKVPVIYVNDNFGNWDADFGEVYKHCIRATARGRKVARALRPAPGDYHILKPKHSAFYGSAFEPLLQVLGVRRLVLAGIATNICVLFTAHDAYMREYDLTVLSDCCAAESDFDHNTALGQLKRFCGSRICTGEQLKLPDAK